MKNITVMTALPVNDHNGNPTPIRATINNLKLGGVKILQDYIGYGVWISDVNGATYRDRVRVLVLSGPESSIRAALAIYGYAAGQQEVLFVQQSSGVWPIVASKHNDKSRGADLARIYGGATYNPQTKTSVSLEYAALVAGVDYPPNESTYASSVNG